MGAGRVLVPLLPGWASRWTDSGDGIPSAILDLEEICDGAAMLIPEGDGPLKVSNFSKCGDIVYALPVLRALHRITGRKIHLLVSGSAWQFALVLQEQPYIHEVELEDTLAHRTFPIERGAIFNHWDWYLPKHGINLSLQPMYFYDEAPISWTHCVMQAAGVTELTNSDCVALPSLVNHRRWLDGIDVECAGKKQAKPKTIILAPETDTLDELMPSIWQEISLQVMQAGLTPVVVGTRRQFQLDGCTDLRGLTSVPVLARLIAESRGFIGAHSFPWHLARHSETPAVCVQTWREGLRRCLPVDTPYTWYDAKDYLSAVPTVLKTMQPVAVGG